MVKVIKILILSLTIFVGMTASISASSLMVRIEEPKSPIGTKNFQIDFVSSDIEGRSVLVTCYVRKPGGSFTIFDSKSLPAGGTSGTCQVTENDMGGVGNHDFYVKATAGSDSVTSPTVSVDFDDRSPGTPSGYTRETISSCQYRIKFRTAADEGVTNQVFLFRSDTTPYSADSGTKVSDLGIGSDTNGEFVNTVPDCNKTYFYSIRAFSSSGMGSGITGDPDATVLGSSSDTPDGQASEAIATTTSQVSSPSGGQVLGDEDGEVLGDEDAPDQEDTDENQQGIPEEIETGEDVSTRSPWVIIGAIGIPALLIIIVIALVLRQNKD